MRRYTSWRLVSQCSYMFEWISAQIQRVLRARYSTTSCSVSHGFSSPFTRARMKDTLVLLLRWWQLRSAYLFSCPAPPQLKKKRVRNQTAASTGAGNTTGTTNGSGNGGGPGAGGGAGGAGGNQAKADTPRDRDGGAAEFVYKVRQFSRRESANESTKVIAGLTTVLHQGSRRCRAGILSSL